MTPASQPKKMRPMALTGKILAWNGAIFIVLGALIGGYRLLSLLGIAPGGNTLDLVTALLAAIFAGVGLLLLLTGLALRLFAGTSPASSVVNTYFAALANQDYTTAFQCLDPYMRAPTGQPITPDWFVQAAQASDSAQGSVTNYSLSGVQANPSRRVYIIKVTRGGRSYKTRLSVQKYGYDWRIMGFDRL